MAATPAQAIIEFLRRRYANAIARGDDRTASRLRAELDRIMNGVADGRPGSELPELPPAA